jgi:copper chaperone NosL
MKPFRSCAILVLFFFAACRSGALEPVEIESADMCSFCRMAISEKKFAAEIITQNDEVLKFDDIGCMLNYQKTSVGKSKAAAVFVMDYATMNWIKADEAFFVHSEKIKTPMSGGMIAFAQKENAEREAVRLETRVSSFAELSTE